MTTIAVIVALALLLVLLAIRTPVAIALGVAGAAGLLLLKGFGYTGSVIGSSPFTNTASFSLTIIPLFILMGMFAVRANMAEHVFAIASRAARRAPGGLGVATVMACAGFSAVSGSSIGTAATMSKLAVGEMRRHGYPAHLASALVAVAGTLGVMIPPSTFLVLYAILAQESVGQMLAAGIIPGIISALAYTVYIMIAGSRITPQAMAEESLAGVAGKAHQDAVEARTIREGRDVTALKTAPPAAGEAQQQSWRSMPWRGLVRVVILFAVVLGGMYSGLFTSTESAAIGALAAFVMLVLENRRKGLRSIFASFRGALQDTGSTTAMVFMIIIGSGILSTFFVAARVPDAITSAVAGLNMPPMLTMALLLLCLIPLGMVLESLSILVITVPILYPIAMELGFDGIWLGILIVKLIEIGMVTPPVGINVFVVAGTSGVPTEQVFRGILPLFLIDLGTVVLLFLVPAITLFLPSLVAVGAG
ncbi:TRAP transporter large permease [Gulosibacter sp. 10]|uniref:TRAP transporter large permease n=1 Tax=Gulosibacter sp. 10 TaxID=1255570 RepID=UPI00097F68C4|nr:TRAP transporter large permease [Gulosibacter sp. 10]SJM71398.1 TRAP-type C4-dicarboxylate transport system, large permease component [Gulosibacter sp. 10]